MNFLYTMDENSKYFLHDFVNKTMGIEIPHEWAFINYLFKYELKKDPKIADIFIMFFYRYHPEYKWDCFIPNKYFDTVLIECSLHDLNFQRVFLGGEDKSLIHNSMIFGNIVTDFLIRFCNYSLICCSGQKKIVTAQSNCAKQFEEFLSDGFELQRLAKLGFRDIPEYLKPFYPEIVGTFYKLPVLPTKDTYLNFSEFIEYDEDKLSPVIRTKNN